MGAEYKQQKQRQRLVSNEHEPNEPVKDLFRTVPLAKRVQNWVERTRAGIVIDIASASLSLLTVVTYMIETHYPNDSSTWLALRNVDLACAAVFAAEWCFWLWLAQHKARYVLSLQSLVDAVTIVPIIAASLIDTRLPGLLTVEALVRVLRVLRVFRIFRVVRRMHNELQARVLLLACTLAAIIVIAAAMFYEIETRFGEEYPDLTIERSIYWGAVTITTIGYGDYSPSVLGSQLMVIGILVITFTVLPYQTNALIGSLSEHNPYLAARYSAARGRHVVVTGHLDAGVMELLLQELYTNDYGFHFYSLVFLGPGRPSCAMQRVLKYHAMNHRMRYLQGSATNHSDLERAQVHAADAVLIMADKTPADSREEDLKNSIACLAIGNFLHYMACPKEDSRKEADKGPLQKFTLPAWLRHRQRQHPTTNPLVCIQLLLPQSSQRLTSWLQGYAALPQHAQHAHPSQPAQGSRQQQPEQGQPGSADAGSDAARFWQGFAQSLAIVCTTEVSYGLMGAACLTPGIVTLLSNLVHSVDASSLPVEHVAALPAWAGEYLAGATHELYEVPLLPRHMTGHSVATITGYLQQQYSAITIAAAGSLPATPGQQAAGSHHAKPPEAAADASNSSQDVAASRELLSVLGRAGLRGRDCRPLWLAPLDHQVLPGTSLFVIAQDLLAVLDIMQDSPGQFQGWLQQQAKWGALPQDCGEAEQRQLPHKHSASRMASSFSPRGLSQQQQQQQQHALSSQAATAEQSAAAVGVCQLPAAAAPAASAGADQPSRTPLRSSSGPEASHPHGARSDAPAGASPAGQLGAPLQQHRGAARAAAAAAAGQDVADQDSSTVLDIDKLQAQQRPSSHGGSSAAPLLLGSHSSAAPEVQRRPGSQRWSGAAAQLISVGAAQRTGSGTAQRASSGMQSRHHHRNRQSVRLDIHALAASHMDVSGPAMLLRSRAALQSQAAQQLYQRRCSGRRAEGEAASALQQRLYHTRQPREPADALQEACVGEVSLAGHILVAAQGVEPSALLALLAPLRSRSLRRGKLAAVVLLDAAATPEGPDWADVAELSDVYVIQASVQDAHALMAANAEQAAVGVLLQPRLSSSSSGSATRYGVVAGDEGAAAAMADARVVAAANTLKSINPDIQLFVELTQYSSLSLLSRAGSLVGRQADEASRAAGSPAYMAGRVLMPSMLDAMVCQTLYNHSTPRLVSQLLSQWHGQLGGQHERTGDSAAEAAQVLEEAEATGQTVQGDKQLENGVVKQQSMDHKQLHAAADAPAKQQGAARMLQHAGGAVLLQVPLAQRGGCATFGELFGWLLAERGMVAAGLYRQAHHQGSSLQYVYTNPDQDTELSDTDSALVLLPHTGGDSQLPSDARHSWQQQQQQQSQVGEDLGRAGSLDAYSSAKP